MKSLLTILLLLSLVFFSSCKQQEPSEEKQIEVEIVGNDTLQIAASTNLKSKIPLTSQAQKGVKSWAFYKNLSIAVDSLQATSLGALKGNLKRFDDLYLAQKEGEEAEVSLTPAIVQTKAIEARLLALETKAKVLNNQAYLNTPDAAQISNQVGEVFNAHQDLNLQLNELFDTSFKDLLEEIKEENDKAASSKSESSE